MYAHFFGAAVLLLVSPAIARFGPWSQEPLGSTSSNWGFDLTDDLLGLHKNLTEIESITGNEHPVGTWLIESLESQGYHTQQQHVSGDPDDPHNKDDPFRFNILAWAGDNSNPKLLLSSHIDTVSTITR